MSVSRSYPIILPLLAALATSTSASAQTAESNASGAAQVAITMTSDNGGSCKLSATEAAAGPVTFTVTNQTATALTEVELLSGNRIIGEKENLAPGLPSVTFTVTLGGGSYDIYCPGADPQKTAFTVTGAAAKRAEGSVSELLDKGTADYSAYVNKTVDAMVVAVTKLDADITAGDLEAAKTDYAHARPFYERIEADVDGFVMDGFDATDNHGNLDYLIDMRASNEDPAVGWSGYHAIERDLFERGAITDDTKTTAHELLKNVKLLDQLAPSLEFWPEDLANGAADLLEEVQSTKISGEEEAYSHIDLADFAGNVEGAEQAFAYLEPGMAQIDPDLTKRVSDEFDKVRALLDGYRDNTVPGGYVLYTDALKASDKVTLSRAIQSLQEPLSRVAEKVATAG
ncbi:iron uptake system protein EfeO [Thioclava sp. GXIMD2076]|uniref:iron uptake system protein EfeO n=1 Tax=Thioclava sp. GXIMD2076 TaxID=3131931 RepID=UPI0030D0A71F